MTRKNIFEILSKKYNIKEEIDKIIWLFKLKNITFTNPLNFMKQENLSIEEVVNKFLFVNWKQRNGCLNCEEIKDKLGFVKLTYKSLEERIILLEYISNLIYLIQIKINPQNNINFQFGIEYKLLCQNIDLLLEHINYEKCIFPRKEKIILVPENPAAMAVAEISSQETAIAILKYHHALLKGQLEEKRKILYSIAHEYEALLSNGIEGFSDYFDKANNMLNNFDIRHNNKIGKKKKEFIINMKPEELEKWYDELYQLLLFCVLIRDNKHRKDEISKFLKQVNSEQK